MTEENISSYFKKSTRTSTRFLRQVWHFDKSNIETIKIYRSYLTKGKCSYINDFVSKSSSLSTNLSTEEILSIHERNADMNDCNIRAGTETDDQDEHSDENNCQDNPLVSLITHTTSNSDEINQKTAHLTDELLDKFHIPPGQKKKRLMTYAMKSELFFHCLSYQIGTRSLIKLRQKVGSRNLNNVLSYIGTDHGFCFHLIGSKSEGLDMEGSDTDILGVDGYAHETKDVYYSCCTYQSLQDGIYPGYVLLKNWGITFSSSIFWNLAQRNSSLFLIHGPAFLRSWYSVESDLVYAIASPRWPKIAEGWITRRRNFGWPSEEMITNISSHGCHIVPVGSNRNYTIDTEWRLSFCVAETELVWTFNQTQILIYGLLKLVLKEIINPLCLKKDLICSYFLKTVMFWIIEETHLSIWSSINMMFLFHLTFNKLVQFIANNECPNYFIPSNNMLKDRIGDVERAHLLQLLFDIEDSGMAWMYKSQSLRPFANSFRVNSTFSRDDVNSLRLRSIQKGKNYSHLLIQQLVFQYRGLISGNQNQNKNIIKSIKTLTIKRNVLPILAHFIKVHDKSMGNKSLASLKKLCMDLFVQEAFGRMPFGKNMLALYFYCEGRFNDCLRVLNSMFGNMDLCITHNAAQTANYDYWCETYIQCDSTLKHVKYFFTNDIGLPISSYLWSNEIRILAFRKTRENLPHQLLNFDTTFVYPETLVHFVRCLCFIKLGINEGFDDAYSSLENIRYVTRRTKYHGACIPPLEYCYAFQNGITLDHTDIASFYIDYYSHATELPLLDFSFLCQDIPTLIAEANPNIILYERGLDDTSDELQQYRKIVSKISPGLRSTLKQRAIEHLSDTGPVVRRAVYIFLTKIGL